MCVRDDEHMSRHLGIREDGKLVAAVGIYPLPTIVEGRKLLFSTVGNVATHWDYVGRGYMNALMDAAMKKLSEMGADASRLGGVRQRYARFGYETCGINYKFDITRHNLKHGMDKYVKPVEFSEIGPDDEKTLEFVRKVYETNAAYVERKGDDLYKSMVAWQNVPYLATVDGEPIGYLCVNSSKTSVSEIGALNADYVMEMLAAWHRGLEGEYLSFDVMANEVEVIKRASSLCQGIYSSAPCHFKIINFDKVIDTYIKLKQTYCELVKGSLVMEIKDYGRIEIFVNDGEAGCVKTDKAPDVVLDKAQASRYIFGPCPPVYAGADNALASAWFPLPLSWNLQNRV